MEAARSRDLKMEAHIQAIAIWYRVSGVLYGVILLIAFLITLGMKTVDFRIRGLIGLGVAVCLLSYLLGHFLKRYFNQARVIAGILAIVTGGSSLIQSLAEGGKSSIFTAGVIFYYGAVCWALFSRRARRICSEKYRQVAERTAYVKPKTFNSPFFWIPMIMFLLTLVALFALLSMMTVIVS